jgi:hypothetical protein
MSDLIKTIEQLEQELILFEKEVENREKRDRFHINDSTWVSIRRDVDLQNIKNTVTEMENKYSLN